MLELDDKHTIFLKENRTSSIFFGSLTYKILLKDKVIFFFRQVLEVVAGCKGITDVEYLSKILYHNTCRYACLFTWS